MNFYLKRNDKNYKLLYSITDENNNAVNLTGCTVQFIAGSNQVIINQPATVNNAANGAVQYIFTQQDTLFEGTFNAEFQVTFADGTVFSYPRKGYLTLTIQKNVNTSSTTVYLDAVANAQGAFNSKLNSILLQAGNIKPYVINTASWTATAGQLTYTMPSGYDPTVGWFNFYIGGTLVDPSLYNRTLSNQITLSVSSSQIPAGISVYAEWAQAIVPFGSGSVFGEILGGTVDGVNKVFTLANTPITGTERIFKNGIRMYRSMDYTISGPTVTFTTAPASGSILLADYNK